MIRAYLQTDNFEFQAFGQTTSHAVNALKRGFVSHAAQYEMPADWWKKYENDISTQYFEMNRAYRDNEYLKDRT